jgi:tetratricopeptide (TPR) repeat protein
VPNRPRILLFLLLAFGFSVPQVYANAEAASHAYAAGVAAARAGQFAEAANQFGEAQSAGMDTPALTYNIGVVNFKLSRLDAAATAFEKLTADASWRPLAHYNLGLIEERRGNRAAAERNFLQALTLATSPELKALAERKLPAPISIAAPPAARWEGLVSFAAGHDDNVLLADDRPDGFVSDEADQFGEFLAAARRPIGDRFALDVSAYYRGHADLDDFDFGSLSAALLWRHPLGQWQFLTSLQGEAQFAGGDPYANMATSRLQLERRAGSLAWRARNDLSYHSGGSDYEFITGWRNVTQLQVGNRLERADLRLGYEFEVNDRDDFTSGEEFASYSPNSHRIYAGAIIDLTPRVFVDLEAGLRATDYSDLNRFIDDDGDVVEGARDQDLVTLRARVDYLIGDSWRVWAQYLRTGSDSDLARYDYTSNAYMLGFETMF